MVTTPGDPAPRGEWLFKKNGQVFGPIAGRAVVEMLFRGELDGASPVAGDDGAWRPLAQIPAFLVHVKKAEAALRVEREVTGARILERRRGRARAAGAAALAIAIVVGAGSGAFWVATRKPWRARSALLEDFGGGVALASAARVGGGRHRAGDDEVEVPDEPDAPGSGPGRRVHAAPRQPVSGLATGGELVVARYDVAHIQAVVAREQRTLAPCLRAEAERSPDFGGEIPIEFAVGNDGRVAQLWIDEPRFRRGELRECLWRALRAWSFGTFPGERPTVSLSFRITSR